MIDNTQSELVGGWTPSTYKVNYYKTDYLYRRTGTGANRVVWRPTLSRGGTYAVYYRLPNGAADRAPDATFTVRHATGAAQIRIDQRVSPGGTWMALGSFVFPPGTASSVELTDRASGTYVIADAVKFVFISDVVPTPAETVVDNEAATLKGTWTVSNSMPNYYGTNYVFRTSGGTGSNTVRWTPRLTESGRYFVYYRLPDGLANRAPDAAYVLAGAGGTRTVKVDQRQASSGSWVSLGSLTFAAGTAAYVELSDKATGTYLIADAIKFVRTDHVYTVRTDIRRQTILGLGVEIQSDSIGSGNGGLPAKVTAVPHDLTATERTRFYSDLLKGFRYVRLAMGLYIRGLTSDDKNIVERYPNQMVDLRQMIQESGIEGASVEYWSPAPYWKISKSLIGGSLAQFDDGFLSDFGDAVVRDLDYLADNGIPIAMFSLQNEPKYLVQQAVFVYPVHRSAVLPGISDGRAQGPVCLSRRPDPQRQSQRPDGDGLQADSGRSNGSSVRGWLELAPNRYGFLGSDHKPVAVQQQQVRTPGIQHGIRVSVGRDERAPHGKHGPIDHELVHLRELTDLVLAARAEANLQQRGGRIRARLVAALRR